MTHLIPSIVTPLLGTMFAVGFYHRIQSVRTGEPLDRTKEGWPLLIGIRMLGLAVAVQVVLALTRPGALAWAHLPLPDSIRGLGVAFLALAVAWLSWMFISLGRNLTDTVVTRRESTLVLHGPYRYVRNPMYTGVALLGLGIGLALENWSIPLTAFAVFTLFAIRTRIEEMYLIARFGDSYREYMRRTGRFLPGLL